MAQGIGLSVVTTMGYSGILFAPSIIGFISEHTGFAAIFAALPLLFLVVLALSHLARYADHRRAEAPHQDGRRAVRMRAGIERRSHQRVRVELTSEVEG